MHTYYPEEILLQKLQDREIGYMEFVLHHSPEYNEEFKAFCRQNGYSLDNNSALLYLEKKDKEFSEAV